MELNLEQAKTIWADQRVSFDPDIPIDSSSLPGLGVIITGAASGIGAAYARAFAEHGAHVAIFDIDETKGRALELELASRGYYATFIHCDVCSYASQLRAFKAARDFMPPGALAHVIANAGVLGDRFSYPSDLDPDLDLPEDPPEPPLRQTTTSLIGVHYTAYLAMHFMGRRHVVVEHGSGAGTPLPTSISRPPAAPQLPERPSAILSPAESEAPILPSPLGPPSLNLSSPPAPLLSSFPKPPDPVTSIHNENFDSSLLPHPTPIGAPYLGPKALHSPSSPISMPSSPRWSATDPSRNVSLAGPSEDRPRTAIDHSRDPSFGNLLQQRPVTALDLGLIGVTTPTLPAPPTPPTGPLPATPMSVRPTRLDAAIEAAVAAGTSRTLAPAARHDCSLTIVGSVMGFRGAFRMVDYCAAKWGVRGILRSLRPDSRERAGVRVNLLAPALIRTPMTAAVPHGLFREAPMSQAVDAMIRVACDTKIHGRSILICGVGNFDLRDDPEGFDGGVALHDFVSKTGHPIRGLGYLPGVM